MYRTYFRFLETYDESFYSPDYDGTFDRARWPICGIGLPKEVLRKIYYENILKIIPSLGTVTNLTINKMIKAKVGFIVYGVHKDGLEDPMGTPFIDEKIVEGARKALKNNGLELVEYNLIIASKKEARDCFDKFRKMNDIDAVILFSGTWVWAAHLIAAVRDFATTGKGIVLWTNPGSQGWRPVGGLVMQGALKEIGIKHRFVYGSYQAPEEIEKITSYCRASAMKNSLNMSTIGTFGGRGMGQTCGAADPSQWMKTFGIDIDSRDTSELLEIAKKITPEEISEAKKSIQKLFAEQIPVNEQADRSISLYLALKN
jgi:L-fucose isomerase-like protein